MLWCCLLCEKKTKKKLRVKEEEKDFQRDAKCEIPSLQLPSIKTPGVTSFHGP